MADDAELARLREENERLRSAVADVTAPPAPKRRVRRIIAAILAFATALLLVLSVVCTWTSRTALDTQKFVARVGPVIDQPTVRTALATELSNQIVAALDVQSRLEPVLPPQLSFLAGPLSSGVDDVVNRAVTRVVNSDAFRKVWYASLTLAHQQVVKALTGNDSNLQIVNGKVVVDLAQVVTLVLQNLTSQLPTVFGTAISLQIPDNLPIAQIRQILSQFLGIQLPEGFAQIPVMDASALESARTGVKVVNLSVLLVGLLTLVALVLAIVVSTNRRRTLLQIGLWSSILTALVFFVVRAITDSALSSITDDVLRPAVDAGVREIFSTLRGFAALIFWLGLLLALVMYLAGPGRVAVGVRGTAVKAGHWTAAQARAVANDEGWASWTARHLDVLRITGAVVAAALLLWLSSWTALLVIGILLVLYEVGLTVYARSTPVAAAEVDAALTADEDRQHGGVGTPT
jgi:hypothetical protein